MMDLTDIIAYDEAVDQHCNKQAETIYYLTQLVEDAAACIEGGPFHPEREARVLRNRLKVILQGEIV